MNATLNQVSSMNDDLDLDMFSFNLDFLSPYSIELEYDEYDYVYVYKVTDIKTGKLIAALEDRYIDNATDRLDMLVLEFSLS